MLGELGLETKKCVAFVGAGGKTTAVYVCVEESLQIGHMAIALTTTKMWRPEKAFFEWTNRINFSDLERMIMKEKPYPVTVGRDLHNGKIAPIPESDMKFLTERGVRLFIEADGAKGKWIKMPNDTEPAVPEFCEAVVGILNQKAVGETFRDVAHRPDFCAESLGKRAGDFVEMKDLYKIWMKRHGIFQKCTGTRMAVLSGFQIGEWQPFYNKYQDIFQKMIQQGMPVFLWEQCNDRQKVFMPDQRII